CSSSTRACARCRRDGSDSQTTWNTSTAAQSTRRATSFFCGVRNLAYLLSAAAAPRSCHPAVPVKTGTTRLKPVRPRSGLVGNVVVHRVAGLALDQVDQPEA